MNLLQIYGNSLYNGQLHRWNSSWQWQPTITEHDPSPPLVLETPSAGGTTYTDTGVGVLILVGTGADVLNRVDAGSAVSILIGAGADAVNRVDVGSAISVLVGAGTDAVWRNDTGLATSALAGSGADGVNWTDSGLARSILSGAGADAIWLVDVGLATGIWAAGGGDAVVWADEGLAISELTASGADDTLKGTRGGGGNPKEKRRVMKKKPLVNLSISVGVRMSIDERHAMAKAMLNKSMPLPEKKAKSKPKKGVKLARDSSGRFLKRKQKLPTWEQWQKRKRKQRR